MTQVAMLVAVFSGIAGVLLLGTLVGKVLAARTGSAVSSAVIQNYNTRIGAFWAMLAVLVVAFALGQLGLIVLFGFLSFGALREYVTLTKTRRGDHGALLAAFLIVLPFQYYLVWIEWYGLYSIFIPVYAFLFLPIAAAVRGEPNQFLERIAELQWGLMISVFCLSHVPALAALSIPGFEDRQLLIVAYFIVVTQASDVLQYHWGKLLGARKIAPTLSPKKTLEGCIGGILSASALGAALWWLTPFTVGESFLMSLILTVLGFLGGLVMSAIKRDRGVKDWGWAIQGHGGILDRVDSIVFAAPVFFHMVKYYWAA